MLIQKFGNPEQRSQKLRKYQICLPGRGALGRTRQPSHMSKGISGWFGLLPKNTAVALFLYQVNKQTLMLAAGHLCLQNWCRFQP